MSVRFKETICCNIKFSKSWLGVNRTEPRETADGLLGAEVQGQPGESAGQLSLGEGWSHPDKSPKQVGSAGGW